MALQGLQQIPGDSPVAEQKARHALGYDRPDQRVKLRGILCNEDVVTGQNEVVREAALLAVEELGSSHVQQLDGDAAHVWLRVVGDGGVLIREAHPSLVGSRPTEQTNL